MSGYESSQLLIILLLLFSSVATICSLLTLYIIRSMGRWNSYIQLVVSLTVSQLLYDLSILAVPCGLSDPHCYSAVVGVRCASGIAATLWTNIISFVVLYVVSNLQNMDIRRWYPYWLAGVATYALLNGVMVPVGLSDQSSPLFVWSSGIYYYTRIVSIVINIVLYLSLTFKLMHRGSLLAEAPSDGRPARSDPVKLLAYRMKYYSICQILTRVAPAIYEKYYGYSYVFEPDRWADKPGGEAAYKAIAILYAVLLPSAGIGYLIIFTYVTPGAYAHLVQLARQVGQFICPCFCPPIASSGEGHFDSKIQVILQSENDGVISEGPGSEYSRGDGASDIFSGAVADMSQLDEAELCYAIDAMYRRRPSDSTAALSGRSGDLSSLLLAEESRDD